MNYELLVILNVNFDVNLLYLNVYKISQISLHHASFGSDNWTVSFKFYHIGHC